MTITQRLWLLMLLATLSPVALFYACVSMPGPAAEYALAAAVLAALCSALFFSGKLQSGLVIPAVKVTTLVRSFSTGKSGLDSLLQKEGWPESQQLISAVNRLMLELNAYRAFHLNQVVEERAKAQALLETIPDGVLLVDDNGRLICSNRRALELLRIPALEPDVVLPGSVGGSEFAAALGRVDASEEAYISVDVAVAADGEEAGAARSYRILSRQFFLATFKRPGRVLIIRDVTIEKEIESARETFFHMITHDMRAPICSIQGYAQLMEKHLPPHPVTGKYLQAILHSSVRLKGMVEDILNTIKLERGEMVLAAQPVDAGELCARVFELHEPLAARRSIKFTAGVAAGGIVFGGDPVLLERVIINLVGNALKFTPSGGIVSLSCSRLPGEVVFQVEDNGPGIPAERQKEVFEKHRQLEEHRHMGFGLGLAMCRMAVELHGGRIWVESEAGRGSRFRFSIPAA